MNTEKKTYKVITAMEKRNGGTYWLRIGSAYTNKDNSINLYLDAIPPTNEKSRRYEFQIRELDAEDLRRRDGTSASSTSSASAGGSGYGSGGFGRHNSTDDAVGGDRLALRDLGGIGGGPTTRAVTSGDSGGSDSIPF